jgi:hypothetical protein
MQKRAGILFISKKSFRVFLILDNLKWTVPSFSKKENVFDDSKDLILTLTGSVNKLIPIELYVSQDNGFEFNTYVCLVDSEFVPAGNETYAWANIDQLPKSIHAGLKSSLSNKLTRSKLETIFVMSQQL